MVHLAIVIPMFNEEKGARRCVERVSAAVSTLTHTGVIVVDDGSSDSTVQILHSTAAAGYRFELVEGGTNHGYGGALRLGAARAAELGAEWVVFMDSDLTNPPEQIGEFLAATSSELDVIKASRYCAGGSTGDVPFKRVLISRWGNLMARVLTGIRHSDLTNGFRAFRTAAYLDMPLQERGFAVILEEMYFARLHNLRVGSLPTSLTTRTNDLRPTAFRYSVGQLWSYLRWPVRTTALRLRRLVGWRS